MLVRLSKLDVNATARVFAAAAADPHSRSGQLGSGREDILVAWTVLGLVLAVLELTAVVARGRFPGIVDLVRRATRSGMGRWLFVLAWCWVGWHFFVR
ncbi:MAG: DUF6186 family protein [Actinobacteria bacterium]|nr:DUF6186 family protein [Actinomycetota bacterium]